MKEITLHVDDKRPDDIHIDGADAVPIEAFLLLTKTRGQDFGHMLVFGGADTMGRMLVNLFRWAVRQDPDSAYTLARAAEDIVEIERVAKGRPLPEGFDAGPMTVN